MRLGRFGSDKYSSILAHISDEKNKTVA